MNPFEAFVQELDKYPKIITYCVKDENEDPLLVNDKAILAETIKVTGETKEEAEIQLMAKVIDFIQDKKVWIRSTPQVTEDFDHDVWIGRARIAVL